jgi:hypothetical protein
MATSAEPSIQSRAEVYRNDLSVRCCRMADKLFTTSGRDQPSTPEVAEDAARLLMEVSRAIDTWSAPATGGSTSGH